METLDELYSRRVATPSDINQHMAYLRALAEHCTHITEFGVRTGNSTVAFAAGLKPDGKLVGYDINPPMLGLPRSWEFIQADTGKLEDIAETDLLFIDTLHDCAQVAAELRHGKRVRKWIVFHDTVLFGTREESTGIPPGINQAIWDFLAANWREWRVEQHVSHNCGLLTLRRTAQ